MIKPTIHINGTSREILAKHHLDAIHALRAAIDAFTETSPNARDYYPQGPIASKRVHAEYHERFRALGHVLLDLEEIHQHIVDAD